MIDFLFGCLATGIALVSLGLLRTYDHVPERELKRRARAGDAVAVLLYRAVAYGASLRGLLWFVIGLSVACGVVLFSISLPVWVAVGVVASLIWVGFVWIPSAQLSRFGLALARKVSPGLAWLLDRINPFTSKVLDFVRKHRPVTIHTGLYEKSDLSEMLENQRHQPDNRIPAGEIDLLTHALSFGDKLVADAYIPKRVVRFVNENDAVGPILMEELHETGHSRFPVLATAAEGEAERVAGVLYLHDLIATKQNGTVRDIMKTKVHYVHEDFTLYQTLQAFIRTKQHLFMVINDFEELSGIITIEDVLEQMVGKLIVDEFDAYDDLRAVAAAAAGKEHRVRQKTDAEPAEAA